MNKFLVVMIDKNFPEENYIYLKIVTKNAKEVEKMFNTNYHIIEIMKIDMDYQTTRRG